MNTKATTAYFAASITVEGRSESENIERIQKLLTKWEKELSKGTVSLLFLTYIDLNLAGVTAAAANFDSVTYDLRDEDIADEVDDGR